MYKPKECCIYRSASQALTFGLKAGAQCCLMDGTWQ